MKGFVYVASVVGNSNLCKIGFTNKKPEDRVSKLKIDYPGYNFELYAAYECENPRHSEHSAHAILYRSVFDREMFSVSPADGCLAVERGLNRRFRAIGLDYADYTKDYLVYSLGVDELSDKDPLECLAIANLCCELFEIHQHNCIYSLQSNLIRKTLEVMK